MSSDSLFKDLFTEAYFLGEVARFPWEDYYILVVFLFLFAWFLLHVFVRGLEFFISLQKGVKSPRVFRILRAIATGKTFMKQAIPVLLAVSLFGLTVGIIAGNSRQPIAEVVVTSILPELLW